MEVRFLDSTLILNAVAVPTLGFGLRRPLSGLLRAIVILTSFLLVVCFCCFMLAALCCRSHGITTKLTGLIF